MNISGTAIDLQQEILGFQFPLNVYAELLRLESGGVDYLHYGLFEPEERDVARAQRRHTEMVLNRLPRPPARILEVGIGMGTTLAELVGLGYEVTGVTPDPAQIRIARSKAPAAVLVESPFEAFTSDQRYDLLLFQESSQYIDAATLFVQADRYCSATGSVLILDEFSVDAAAGLHQLASVLSSAKEHGFELYENTDLSSQAFGTLDYLLEAVERRRSELEANLRLGSDALSYLCASNLDYRRRYLDGLYQYRCLMFSRS